MVLLLVKSLSFVLCQWVRTSVFRWISGLQPGSHYLEDHQTQELAIEWGEKPLKTLVTAPVPYGTDQPECKSKICSSKESHQLCHSKRICIPVQWLRLDTLHSSFKKSGAYIYIYIHNHVYIYISILCKITKSYCGWKTSCTIWYLSEKDFKHPRWCRISQPSAVLQLPFNNRLTQSFPNCCAD